jgi:hypothetical protein
MTQRVSDRGRLYPSLSVVLLMVPSLSAGCYRHVISAKGPGASAYEIQEPADENTVVVSEFKPQPKSKVTKGGRPVN